MPTSTVSEPRGHDVAEVLAETVRAAAAARRPLRIVGGDSKAFYGRPVVGEPIVTAAHRGIVDYAPSELVVTVRAGTPIAELEAVLAAERQMLAFEPPILSPASTVGGVLAAGLAGPRRPFAGAVRDAVLGVTILDGLGRRLSFGGVVFKNVAGFDAFRLMVGSLGCLGLVLESSFRLAPRPAFETALRLDVPAARLAAVTADWLARPTPVSGLFHDDEGLHVRLSGSETGVVAAARRIGGEVEPMAAWTALRNLQHPLLREPGALWRLSLPQAAPDPALAGPRLWDWGGAQRWLKTDEPAEVVRRGAAALGGHATRLRGLSPADAEQGADGDEVFSPLAPGLMALHKRLKAAFDPHGVLNPGRMYAEL